MKENLKKYLSLEERKKIQLEMLIEIDNFCRSNNIKYALTCGTLIGAIRHKGFIPWDDDVDITMPYEDMCRFKKLFKSETIRYCDVDTEPGYGYHFSRLVHNGTYSKVGIATKEYGLCIDLYPVIKCSNDKGLLELQLKDAENLLKTRLRMKKYRLIILKLLPLPCTNLPLYTSSVKRYRNYYTHNMRVDGQNVGYHQLAGPVNIFYSHYWQFDQFETLIDVEFEGHYFWAPQRYDEVLRNKYGDYMKLPPLEDRIPYHGRKIYWK